MSKPPALDVAVPDSLEDLKELIKTRLEKACAVLPGWYWSHDETIDLRSHLEADSDKVQNLFFGNIDDFFADWEDSAALYLSDARADTVKNELKDVLSREFSVVIAEFAEANDLDEDDLLAELEDDEFFEPSNLDVPDTYYDYKYSGSVSVIADTRLSLQFTPDGDLFHALRSLRIEPKAFLGAALAHIADESDDLTLDAPGPFEKSVESSDAESLAQAYEDAFWQGMRSSSDSALFSEFDLGEPIVDVAALVKFIANGSDDSSVYVHTTCSGTTIDAVSSEIPCHNLGEETTVLEVREGFLSSQDSLDYIDDDNCLPLRGPIPVKLKEFRIRKASPDDVSREVSFEPGLQAEVDLYRALLNGRSGTGRPSAALSAEDLLKLADAVPAYRADAFAKRLEIFRDNAVLELVASVQARLRERDIAPLPARGQVSTLLDCLAPTSDWNPRQTEQAIWLISKGVDVNEHVGTGVTPLMLAARQGNPALVSALLDAGADVHAEAVDPLSGCRENAASIVARTCALRPSNERTKACLALLVDAGARLPSTALRLGGGAAVNHEPLRFAISARHPELVRRAAEDLVASSATDMQKQLDAGLYFAGTKFDHEVGFVLVESGASPEAMLFGAPVPSGTPLRDALRACLKKTFGKTEEDADNFLGLMRAHLARRAMRQVSGRVGAAISAARRASP
jgi:hypothetical protein